MDELSDRPWPRPRAPWVMAQTWHDLLFAHWPVDVAAMRRVVPGSLPLDTYDGQAWIAVVPFWMSGVRPRLVPGIPWFSTFPELNVRTYVTVGGKPGVYFFSLDATNPVAVWLARAAYHLPYVHATMRTVWRGGFVEYRSQRTDRRALYAEFSGRYRPIGDVFRAEPGSLVDWLTARFCLYAVDRRGRVYRAEIDHVPWPLQNAEAEIDTNTMVDPTGLTLPGTPPLLHFARRLKIVAWLPQRLPPQT